MLIMSAALATALFVATIFVREFKISKEVADSMKAVYTADSAMEYTLYQTRILATDVQTLTGTDLTYNTTSGSYELTTSECKTKVFGAVPPASVQCKLDAYPTVVKGSHPGCPSGTSADDCTRVTAKGTYGTTNRVLEIVYPNL